METMALSVRRLGYAMGAEVSGLDLRRPLEAQELAEVRRLWLEHIVLCFPDQDLEPAELMTFASNFGELDDNRRAPHNRHPDHDEVMILENKRYAGGTTKRVPDTWHSDLSYTDRPSTATFLNAKVLPDVGGATQFVNTYLAYETLSDGLKAFIEPLEAVHDVTLGPTFKRAGPELANEIRTLNPPVAHRIVRVHPETGRKALYLGDRTRNVVGWTEEESRPLLDFLNAHARRYEFMYRHRWELGQLVMWDNRCALHYAAKDYDTTQVRRMLRCSVRGRSN
jgi:taurine dioxygenase